MTRNTALEGMKAFLLIWVGQLFSLLGSGLTGFALGVWAYQETGSVTQFAIIAVSAALPGLLIAPLAGTVVDRADRRLVMIVSDSVAALSTLAVVVLFFTDQLAIWHLYVTTAVASTAGAFQWPAYSASIPLLVPKRHLGRANGLLQLSAALEGILSPLLGGVLLVTIGLQGVILIDFVTFFLAIAALLWVRIPRPEPTAAGATAQGSLWRETAHGWTYLVARPGLVALLLLFAVSNFAIGLITVLVTPLVLAVASAAVLGTVMSVGGVGMLIGSLLMSTWGGPQRRIYGVLGFMLLAGLSVLLGGLQPAVPIFIIAAFGYFFALPFINGCNTIIWQSKVALDMQGRLVSLRSMIGGAALPLGYFMAGPLADRIFEPLLATDGPLAGSVGQIIGIGPGRGVGLIFILAGAGIALFALAGYLYPRLRLLDVELPDVVNDEVSGMGQVEPAYPDYEPPEPQPHISEAL